MHLLHTLTPNTTRIFARYLTCLSAFTQTRQAATRKFFIAPRFVIILLTEHVKILLQTAVACRALVNEIIHYT